MSRKEWPLYEVFIRSGNGLNLLHVGRVHAPDPKLALENARDAYTRRGEGVSIWVVASNAIAASDPGEKASLFEPLAEKVYRHPTFYDIPDEVKNI